MIVLTVVQGKNSGDKARFDAECIKLGRNVKNDFTVHDQFVSKWHGEIVRQPHGYLYRDLSSRHGTIVSFLDQIVRLRKGGNGLSCYLSHGSRIQVGQTVIELAIDVLDSQLMEVTPPPSWSGGVRLKKPAEGEDGQERKTKLSEKKTARHKVLSLGAKKDSADETPSDPLWAPNKHEDFDDTGALAPMPQDLGAIEGRLAQSLPDRHETPPGLDVVLDKSDFQRIKRTRRMPAASERLGETSHFHNTKTLVLPPADLLRRNFARRDPRLQILMRLSGQLNGLSRLSDIIDLIVSTTFAAFPLTHCFSIKLFDSNDTLISYVSRFCSDDEVVAAETVLCERLIERVVESTEALLYERGKTEGELSKSFIDGPTHSSIYAPLLGQRSLLGVFTITSKNGEKPFSVQDLELFSVLASNVAFSLERAKLTENIFSMFEGFVRASVVAIEARDPTTAGHSERVASYTLALAEQINRVDAGELADLSFSPSELTELRYAALLHDFGKVGVREQVLNKSTRLPEHCMEVIKHRFEMLKEKHRRWMLEALVRELGARGRVPDSNEMLNLEKEHLQLAERLDRIVDFLEAIRRVNFLDSAMREKLKQLEDAHIRFGTEGEYQLLYPEEIADLSVTRGNLNEEEWDDMKSHASKTEVFLTQIPWSSELRRVPCIAGAHHEKLDGSGYPAGLTGNAILPQVRIMTIADIFDAVTANDRPYRRAASVPKALGILVKEADSGKLDKRLVQVFAERVLPRVSYLIPKRASGRFSTGH